MDLKLLIVAVALVLVACQPQVACTQEAKLCADGSAVGRIGSDCEFAPCPEVDEPSTPQVPATPEQSTFLEYKSTDAAVCARIRYTCDGDEAFGDETGCGCVREHNDPAVTLCATQYEPVCGWNGEEIRCFAYPCATTYSNLCMASIEAMVASTTPGECPKPGSVPVVTPPTIPAAVTIAYDELEAMYGDSLGAKIERCVSEPEILFVVSGSGGFGGVDLYFTQDGNLLGSYEWDDMIIVGEEEPMPPRDLSRYTCDILKQTVSKKRQVFDCVERTQACTKIYEPVCGQLVLNTGDVTMQTYPNSCEACREMKVMSYLEGACE